MSIINSKIYSSINENREITNLFFVNISNLLYSRSNVRNLNKILKKEVVDRMINETVVKEVYIERFKDDQTNEIIETVMDIQIPNNNEDKPNFYLAPALFADQESKKQSVFKRIKNLHFINSNTTKAYSFKDMFQNSSLRKDFKYRIELSFVDGMSVFLENILKNFKNNLILLDQIKMISENQRLILQGGSYNLNNFNKNGLPNAIGLDRNLSNIVGFYYDVLNLLKTSRVDSTNVASLKSEEFGKTSFVSGKHEYLLEFYDKYNRLYDYLRTTSDESEKDIQLLGNNKSKRGVKANSRKTSIKEIELTIVSDEIDHYSYYDGTLNYVLENGSDGDVIATVTKQNLFTDSIVDEVDGGIKKRAYSFTSRGTKEAITDTSNTMLNISNTFNHIQTTKAVPNYQEVQTIDESQSDLNMNSLLMLGSKGITFDAQPMNREKILNNTAGENYFSGTDSLLTAGDLSKNTDDFAEVESIMFAEIPSSLAEIAKNLVFNDCFSSAEQKPVYSTSKDIFDPTMTNKIEYLSGFDNPRNIYEFFNPVWKPLTSATFTSIGNKGYVICRNLNRTNNPLTNYISTNEYFLVYLG